MKETLTFLIKIPVPLVEETPRNYFLLITFENNIPTRLEKNSLSITMTTMFAFLYCLFNKGGVLMSLSQFPDVLLSF